MDKTQRVITVKWPLRKTVETTKRQVVKYSKVKQANYKKTHAKLIKNKIKHCIDPGYYRQYIGLNLHTYSNKTTVNIDCSCHFETSCVICGQIYTMP